MKDRGNDPSLENFVFGGGTSEPVLATSSAVPEVVTARERIVRRDGDYALIEKANGEFVVRDFSVQTAGAPAPKPVEAAPTVASPDVSEFNLQIRRDAKTTSAQVSFSNDAADFRGLFGNILGATAGSQSGRQLSQALGNTEQAASTTDLLSEGISQPAAETHVPRTPETAQRVGAFSLRGEARRIWRRKVGVTILAATTLAGAAGLEAYGLASGGEHLNPLHPLQTVNTIQDDFSQLINHPFGTITEQAGRL